MSSTAATPATSAKVDNSKLKGQEILHVKQGCYYVFDRAVEDSTGRKFFYVQKDRRVYKFLESDFHAPSTTSSKSYGKLPPYSFD